MPELVFLKLISHWLLLHFYLCRPLLDLLEILLQLLKAWEHCLEVFLERSSHWLLLRIILFGINHAVEMIVDVFEDIDELTLQRFAIGYRIVGDGSSDEVPRNYKWRLFVLARERFSERVIRALNRPGTYLISAFVTK
jgi:hypothetical protein